MEHRIVKELLSKRVHVHLAGVGGNGAQMAACLARLDIAMRALGHPHGLFVTAIDDDVVSEANVGRQMYSPADVGQLKAAVTIHRINLFYGLDWQCSPCKIEQYWERCRGGGQRVADVLVSCVDSKAARRAMHEYVSGNPRYHYWLDLGNREFDGQVVLGQPPSVTDPVRLPCVTELFPELLADGEPEDALPSCSLRLSLASQGLFVNDFAVRYASQLLYELFSQGRLANQGAIFNTHSLQSRPIAIDADVWRRFGYRAQAVDDLIMNDDERRQFV
jgi:PRTRC genetic system ThiF family protein